jgi:hypothetical protein
MIVRAANDPRNMNSPRVSLQRRIQLVAVETTRVLEDGCNLSHAANLIVPRDRSVMRRRAAAKVQTNFIDIAPSPPFRRIVAFDDGTVGLAKMLGGVTVWRAVAAADMAARPADSQMHPRRTKFQTFLASERARRYVTDGSDVRTSIGH